MRGLGDKDRRWESVLERDNTGFRGLTTYAPIPCRPASERRYSRSSILRKDKDGQLVPYEGTDDAPSGAVQYLLGTDGINRNCKSSRSLCVFQGSLKEASKKRLCRRRY